MGVRTDGGITVLVNPAAGRGQAAGAARLTATALRTAGHRVDVVTGTDGDDTARLARRAVEGGATALVAVGGDGMVNLALQAVAGTDVALGVVPSGTGNDVARYLDVPRDNPARAAAAVVGALAAGRTRAMDLARTSGGRVFATVLCAGFDAVVNERANRMRRPRGQVRYTLATLAELRTLAPRHYTLDLDGESLTCEATLVSVGNGPSFGGGLRITQGAKVDDGLLDVVIIEPLTRRDLVRTYPRLFAGTHTTHRAYRHHRVRSVTVAAAGIVAYADGERFGPLPMTVECVPGAVRVLVPEKEQVIR